MKATIAIALGLLILAGCEELDMKEPGLLVPRTVDQDSSLPSINVNGTQLHSESFGNPADPMIVVLHGGPGGDYRGLLNARQFSGQGFYVVFYDQRGSGLSRRERKSDLNPQLMMEDLSAVISHYRSSPDQKVILLGHSWGAMLATMYINEYPSAIDGTILIEPGGFIWKDVKAYVSRLQSYPVTGETLTDVTYVDQFITAKATEQEILDYKFGLIASSESTEGNNEGNDGYVPHWRLGATVNRALFEIGEREWPNWTTNLRAYTRPVLFLFSERNKAYGEAHAIKVSSAYPNAHLERIAETGHNMLSFSAGWNNFYPVALNYLNDIKE